MAWITPKVDWLPNDYYAYGDMDRVENNIKEMVSIMQEKGVAVTITPGVTTRNEWWVPFEDDFKRIESNLDKLRQPYTPVGWVGRDLPWTPEQPFGYADANRWELNLLLLWQHYHG
ncbi:hypothetical protein [Paenibacillus riograndensis]|uniref:Uncharacterized protein n=1 Tax=Paenibacillus riograndensis SBR5 TaxID=1073571 RepID=A0A0E4CU43_9BACL|nr:hypothetical protein [Paenibacillus riograndensis]CQR51489.1 hypothetical protein PRIO_0235 [Paenibacillus riograndensis SBR5]